MTILYERTSKRTFLLFILLLMVVVTMLVSRSGYTDNLHIKAPEIVSDSWLNTEPVSMSELHGKVVLVEFWTFGCSNCRNVEPYVKAWYEKFHADGLEIISIHSPEFGYEREIDNVRQYVNRQGIKYDVAIDNDFVNWKHFNNQFWPTLYLIDKEGYIRYQKIGEGGYTVTEQQIKALLQES